MSGPRPLRLGRPLLDAQDRERIAAALRAIVRSVNFEVLEGESSVRLLGPDMSYHRVDPHLPRTLRALGLSSASADILAYRVRTPHFDLCFEDSWSGGFIADELGRMAPSDDLVIVHLDDHTDMMPTLLAVAGDALFNPMTRDIFDPADRRCWEAAIAAGEPVRKPSERRRGARRRLR